MRHTVKQTEQTYWWRATQFDEAFAADIPEGAVVFGEGSQCPHKCIPDGQSEPCRVVSLHYATGSYTCRAKNTHEDLPRHFVSCDGWSHMIVVKLDPEPSRHYVPGRLIERNGESVE